MQQPLPQHAQLGDLEGAFPPPQADNPGTVGTQPFLFLQPSTLFAPDGYSSYAWSPAYVPLEALTPPAQMGMAAMGAFLPQSAPAQELPAESYFGLPGTSIDAASYYQHGAESAPVSSALTAHGWPSEAWLGINNSLEAAVAGVDTAAAQPQQLHLIDVSQNPTAHTAWHEGGGALPSPQSSVGSSAAARQSPWGMQWDAATWATHTPISPTTLPIATGADSIDHGNKRLTRPALSAAGRQASHPTASISPGVEYEQHQAFGHPGGYLISPSLTAMGGYHPFSAPGTASEGRSPSFDLVPRGGGPGSAQGCSPSPYHSLSPFGPATPGLPGGGAVAHGSHSPSEATPPPGIEVDYLSETQLKQQDLRRRNRKAASKCRSKTRSEEARLRDEAWAVTETWTELSAEVAKLEGEVRGLKRELNRHEACGNSLITDYLGSIRLLNEAEGEKDAGGEGGVAKQASL